MIDSILDKSELSKDDVVALLNITDPKNMQKLFQKAYDIKRVCVNNIVYFRGLIEFSNICGKNCYYCGIRSSNKKIVRYNVSDKEILEAARFALNNKYASMVLQSGELCSPEFIKRVSFLTKEIKKLSDGKLGITLCCGEQTEETYRQWFDNGAHRYLLRIETSNPDLYKKIHPDNKKHGFTNRLKSLELLQKTGYQTGTGVMIGLPFQTNEDLADDLLFMRNFDIDMVGMGPYIEHPDTPLFQYRHLLKTKTERFRLALRMIAILRILLKDINIAATTALQAIDPVGREKALKAGANVMMPNLTPLKYREDYLLYEDKPCMDEDAEKCKNCLEARIHLAGDEIGYDQWGDSIHFEKRTNNK